DWEQRKLGDLFQQRTEKASGDEDLLSVTIADGVIRQKDSDKRNVSSDDKSNYKIVRKGDLAYNSMRMWQGAVGESDFFGIVSPAYTVLRPLNDLDTKFFMELFKKKTSLDIFRRWSQGLTSDTWNLKFPVLSKITFRVTKSSEQSKIGEFLSSLDHLITLHQRKRKILI
ncbi:restriction endonuclease subunit S, partial [Alloscardovia criceti]|uniref:restriction endonuclease subunit S n=1 Tax=Alloscardovia criceti TaxID=356828 RepID=UPI0003655D51